MKNLMVKNHKQTGNKHHKGGFTLIELLISILIFTIFLGIVSQSYLSIVRSQRQANEVRKMYSELRVFMDAFAEDVRLGAVDYNCYDPINNMSLTGEPLCDAEALGQIVSGKSNVLSLVRKGGGEKTSYKIVEDDLTGKKRLKMKKWYKDYLTNGWQVIPGYEDFRDVFSERIEVAHASFAIFPGVNPYSSFYYTDNAVQFQPKVTLFLNVKNPDDSDINFDYQFQTTISSRVYSREI